MLSLRRFPASRSLRHHMARSLSGVPMSVHEPDRTIDYAKIGDKADKARAALGRPLTYAEKIVYGHLDANEDPARIVKGTHLPRTAPREWLCLF